MKEFDYSKSILILKQQGKLLKKNVSYPRSGSWTAVGSHERKNGIFTLILSKEEVGEEAL